MRIRLELEGRKIARDNFVRFRRAIRTRFAPEGLKPGAERMKRRAQEHLRRNGSVDTGTLLRSLRVEARGQSAVVATNVKYAPFVEFGTRGKTGTQRTRPKPYLRPSVAPEVRAVCEDAARALESIMRSVAVNVRPT